MIFNEEQEKNLLEAIRTELAKKALNCIKSITEDLLPVGGAVQMKMKSMMTRKLGRIQIVNRVRNGKVQFNKKVDVMGKGYKLLGNGMVVKMTPQEISKRAKGAKIGARKRKFEMAQILRKRAMSNARRFGM